MRSCGVHRVIFSLASHQNCPVSWPAACASETRAASTAAQASSRTPWPRSSAARRCGTPPSASCSAPHRKSSGPAAGSLGTKCSRPGGASGCRPRYGTSSPCAACGGRTRPASEGKQQKRTRRTRVTGIRSCERFVCRHTQNSLHALILRICDSACLNFSAILRVPEVRRLARVSRWSSARP